MLQGWDSLVADVIARARFLSPISKIDPNSAPSSLELLTVPYAFSQRRLLNPSAFVRDTRKRGVSLLESQLELLHRRRLLVPLFRMYSRQVEASEHPNLGSHVSGWAGDVHSAKAQGRLRDPGKIRFRPWPKPGPTGGVFYSWYQLLALRQLGPWVRHFKGRRVGDGVDWELPPVNSMAVETAHSTRALAIILEVLSPRYRPQIVRKFSIPPPIDRLEIQEHIRSTPTRASSEQTVLSGIEPGVLLGQAEDLLSQARFFDPLGDWYQVVRAGTPNRWEDLKFDALQAMDWRIAAEMLLLFYEDVAEQGLADPMPEPSKMWPAPRHDRLKINYLKRSEALQRFRLENSPAVLVAVEGDTEGYIMPRALDWTLGSDTGLVDIVNIEGIDKDVSLIARAVTTPKLDEQLPHRGRLLRPLTALVVAVDQEKRYGSPEKQQSQRDKIIRDIWKSLPEAFQTPTVLEDLQYLVVVETWGEQGSFEFAHFTDKELAQAIHRIARQASRTVPPPEKIEEHLAPLRENKQNIEKVWKNRRWGMSKVKLAKQTWPILHRKLAEQDHMEIPIGRTLQTIVDLVSTIKPVTHLRTDDNT